MKELYQITQELKEVFNLEDISEFRGYISEKIENNQLKDLKRNYMSVVESLDTDWIQKVYQYNMAKRKSLKQDYTPPSLSKLISKMIKGSPGTIYDVCSGSGSLTLQCAKEHPDATFILHELDEEVIPYLLFNLYLHDINAIVINGNVMTGEQKSVFEIKDGEIVKLPKFDVGKYDVVISNPPFNLKNNGNAFFLNYFVEHSLIQAIAIMHKVPVKPGKEQALTQELLDKNILYRVVINPQRFFESTPTETVIVECRKDKKNNSLYVQDGSFYYTEYTRHQNGQFGEANTKRTYHKTFNKYNDEQIENIANIWRGPRTAEYSPDLLKCDEIPSSLFPPCGPYGRYALPLLYGDSEEVIEKLQEQKERKEQKEKERLEKSMKELRDLLLSVPDERWEEIKKAIIDH